MSHEIKPVRISMILLIISGMFVYGLFFSAKGSELYDQVRINLANNTSLNIEPNTEPNIEPKTDSNMIGSGNIQDTDSILSSWWMMLDGTWNTAPSTTTWSQWAIQDDDLKVFLQNAGLSSWSVADTNTPTDDFNININNSTTQDTINSLLKDQNIPILSWVESYFEPVTSYERLAVVPKHVFASPEDIYIWLLSTWSYNRPRIARTMQGNTVAFSTEKDMIQNNLPGQSVTFINLPEYKGTLVVMVVTIDTYNRIIQIPTKIYHQSKDTLKNILWDQ